MTHIVESRPLIVSATKEEAAYLPEDVPVLITGIGTLAAAIKLTALLAEARAEGRTPSHIINIGTAGGLKDGVSGVFEIATVFKHDLDRDVFEDATGRGWGEPYELKKVGPLPAAGLATGDSFIRDSETRARLGHYAELVDMEGVAFVEVARFFDIPITLIKQVSDSADENAATTWFDVVDHSAKEIAAVVGEYL
ncbi:MULTISPECIES: nucleosidase [Corynebacterium]|uniref:nucleosidase n=1 Tax=Corynebacterium TaxID=1716 RepID=UPI00124BD6DF|nr:MULTISPECIES: nucleosidase [Corynebacterium]